MLIKPIRRFKSKTKQTGSVLFVSLIILFLLTIIGLSSMNNSQTELKLAANLQEKQIANQNSQAGIDAVNCLAATTDNNPLDKTYSILNIDNSTPNLLFDWVYNVYDKSHLNPFDPQPKPATTCAIDKIDTDLKAVIKRSADGKALRSENASSYDEIKCQNFIVDSRYQYASSKTSSASFAGICREKINYN